MSLCSQGLGNPCNLFFQDICLAPTPCVPKGEKILHRFLCSFFFVLEHKMDCRVRLTIFQGFDELYDEGRRLVRTTEFRVNYPSYMCTHSIREISFAQKLWRLEEIVEGGR